MSLETSDTQAGGKRIEAKDLREKNRKPLQDIVPVRTPFVVYVESTNMCNFKCTFCPTGDKDVLEESGRPNGTMKFAQYKKIIDDLKEFPDKLKLLSLYKDGEPLVHKQMAEMIAYARDANIAERIWTKTNGALLNPKTNQALVDAGLSLITISVEAVNAKGYLDIAKVKIDYEKFKENIADLYARRGNMDVYIKIVDTGLSDEDRAKFYADFQPISTHVAVEQLMGWSYSNIKDFTLGKKPDTYDGLPLIEKIACAYPLYVMAVNWNGTVSLCGNDWAHKTVVGDTNKESLKQIWEGENLYQFRRMMLEGRRGENKACGDCYYLKIVPDNIDAHREDILKKLSVGRPHVPFVDAQPTKRGLPVVR
ncbi:MAG: radical SAM protein [Deltaproteobacteria bacterium]|nr:radical SAM protein [Deltaproteobacteria bacterium]